MRIYSVIPLTKNGEHSPLLTIEAEDIAIAYDLICFQINVETDPITIAVFPSGSIVTSVAKES